MASVDAPTRAGAAQPMIILDNGQFETRLETAFTGLVAPAALHHVPAVVQASWASSGLMVDLFQRILTDIGDEQVTCNAIERKPPRIAQSQGPYLRTSVCSVDKRIAGRYADVWAGI